MNRDNRRRILRPALGGQPLLDGKLRASIFDLGFLDTLAHRSDYRDAPLGGKMTEVEFVLRRILREGHDYAKDQNETRRENPALALHRYTAQIQLLNHLERQFLERNENDKQD